MDKITVKAVWEFEFDASDFDPKFVDIEGLAKDAAKTDLEDLMKNDQITADDFYYIIEKENE